MTPIKKFQLTFDVIPPPPAGFATWDDFKRSQPPESSGIPGFACVDPALEAERARPVPRQQAL
ncbi:hypothetical protein [Streptomyces sp. NPDC050546]|uniref:hypothetical protein n=1 Tax=Streptomyces sp. NPDC050546 TaxID=3365628 RepID=UPI00379ACB6A